MIGPFTAENVGTDDASSRVSSAIFFLLCLIPALGTVLYGAVDEMTWVILVILWCVIVALWLAEARKGNGFLINASPLLIPVTGLLVLGVLQLLPLPFIASINQSATRFFVERLTVYLVFFAACLTFINNKTRLKKAVWFIVIFGAAMAFFGVLQWLANPSGIYGLRQTPQAIPFGPFVNQHHFAAFMEMTAGVTLGMLFGSKRKLERTPFLVFAVVIMGAAVAFTGSRGGLLSFASVLGFVMLMRLLSPHGGIESAAKRSVGIHQKISIAAAGLSIIIVILGFVLFLGGNDSLMRGTGMAVTDDISTGRFHFWPIAIKIFLEYPLFGAGFDAFGVAFTKYDTWNGFFRVEQAHNEYLQTLAESGVIGLLCVAAFIFVLFKKGIAVILSQRGFRKSAAVGAMAGCFGILVHSFFDFPLRTHSNAFFFLMLAAIATVPIVSDRVRSARRGRGPSEHL